jgi:hypothetical protein
LHLHKPKMWDSSQGMHKPKAESGHAQTKDREAGRKASLTKDKGMCYHSSSRRLAQTKDVGFISGRAQTKGRVRACTNPRQREAGRKASLTKVKGMCYHSRRLALTKEVGFIRACTNQRQSQGMHKPKAERGHTLLVAHLGQLTRTNQRASLTKVKGMCYNSRRLALTKEVGFIRACTNQRQREAGRKASLTKVKVREARWKVSLTKGRDARWKVSLTKGGFSSGTACTNQRHREARRQVSLQ